jgi:hypothetical protein
MEFCANLADFFSGSLITLLKKSYIKLKGLVEPKEWIEWSASA